MANPPKSEFARFIQGLGFLFLGFSGLCFIGAYFVYRGEPNVGELQWGMLGFGGVSVLFIALARLLQNSADARYFAELAAKKTEGHSQSEKLKRDR
jgi:hypothetical protein